MSAAAVSTPDTLWHVTLILAGAPAPMTQLGRALRRLCDLDPGNMGARFRADQAEVQFWDEGADISAVAFAAAHLWEASRDDAGLPQWSLVAIEVMDKARLRQRQQEAAELIAPGSVARSD